MLHLSNLTIETAVANRRGTPESDTILKHGRKSESLMNRGNFLKVFGIAAVIPFFLINCNEDEETEPVDPIKTLEVLEKKLATEVRTATVSALTQPADIQAEYWGDFDGNNDMSLLKNDNPVPASNLLDSAKVHIKTINGKYKNHPTNSASINEFYKKCNAYVPVAEELEEKQLDKRNEEIFNATGMTIEEIQEYLAMEKQEATKTRKAEKLALSQPFDISEFYWITWGRWHNYDEDSNKMPPAENLVDSAKVHIKTIDVINEAYNGEPMFLGEPMNPVTFPAFYKQCKEYIPIGMKADGLRQWVK